MDNQEAGFGDKGNASKMKLLDRLLGKQEPLQDYEEALKQKLITELMSNYLSVSVVLVLSVKSSQCENVL